MNHHIISFVAFCGLYNYCYLAKVVGGQFSSWTDLIQDKTKALQPVTVHDECCKIGRTTFFIT